MCKRVGQALAGFRSLSVAGRTQRATPDSTVNCIWAKRAGPPHAKHTGPGGLGPPIRFARLIGERPGCWVSCLFMADPVRHAWLRALGRAEMPERIRLRDGEYVHLRTWKHDFFAATGLYEGPSGRVVLKLGRTARLLGLPASWIGRLLCNRELDVYRAVDDLPGIPECFGKWGATGLVHAFVEGHPLQKREQVNDEFFPRLERLIDELHHRDIAYVDLEKRENILVDSDGRPCLIDFQISWRWPADGRKHRTGMRRLIPDGFGRFLLAKLQAGDRYHLLKHRRRHRPDTLTAEEIEASYRLGFWHDLHRRVSRPLTLLRRTALRVLTGRWRSLKQDGPEFLGQPPPVSQSTTKDDHGQPR